MKNQWQNNLRDRMERHEEPAPDGLWNRIEQIMNAGSYNKAVQARRNTLLWGPAHRNGSRCGAYFVLYRLAHPWIERKC